MAAKSIAGSLLKLGQNFKVDPKEVKHAFEEVTRGRGFYVVKGAFTKEEITLAADRIHGLAMNEKQKATHFTSAKADLQKRVWNLLNKGDQFQVCLFSPAVFLLLLFSLNLFLMYLFCIDI